jgi:hypothetical protein
LRLCGNLIKKRNRGFEDSFCVCAETSLKNETEVTSIVLVSMSRSLKNEIVFPPLCLSQVLHLVFEASFHSPLQLNDMKLGGHLP